MKVIIFGGSGFLGSHVADVLTNFGYEVTVYDLQDSPYLKKNQNMIVGDILDANKVKKAIDGQDYVYNFAGISDIEESINDPIKTIQSNVVGNAIILEASRHAKIKRLIFASSLYVYSKSGSFYRSTKQACELLIEDYKDIFGLCYTILRYGSLYGPRSSDRNFVHRIIKDAISKGVITREGDGEEIREYIHVHDAAVGSVEILSDEFINQNVIITGNQRMRVKDLIFMIKEMMGDKIEVEFLSPEKNSHYKITPYLFAPKIGKRLVNKTYIDLGQGMLETMYDLYKNIDPLSTHGGILINSKTRKTKR